MINFKAMKLGKQKPKYDRRTLQFHKYLTMLPFAPQVSHWPNAAPLGMLLNDTVGDCTIAAALHQEMIWSKSNGLTYSPVDNDALVAYEAVTASENNGQGYDPTTGANDNGCSCVDVLSYWKNTGIGGRKIGAFVQVDTSNHVDVQHAAFFFGGLYIGIQMPISAQNQPNIWDVPPIGLTGNGTPGSWGGHCIYIAGYDQNGLDVVTWGERIRMTWKFWNAYVDECYAALSTDFVNNPAKAPNGFNMVALQQDLELISGTSALVASKLSIVPNRLQTIFTNNLKNNVMPTSPVDAKIYHAAEKLKIKSIAKADHKALIALATSLIYAKAEKLGIKNLSKANLHQKLSLFRSLVG